MLYLLAGLTAAQLADCPDASAYAQSIHDFMWSGTAPALITFSGCRLVINILYSVFNNV